MELQFITHFTDTYSYYDSARMALEGGCRWIQLRMKDASLQEIEQEALRMQSLCKSYGATFIIDDHVELVKKLHADGVHLGKNDMPVAEARKMLGKDFIIGGTANTFEDVKTHYEAGADYIGCGPFRFTTTKKNLSPVLGLEGYRSIIRQMKEANIHLPIVAIGGITFEDIPAIIETGVTGIALSGTILRAEDPVAETKRIVNIENGNEFPLNQEVLNKEQTKTVKLITCNDAFQAHIIQGALENEGIPSVLHNENTSNVMRGYISAITGVDVLVYETDYDKAFSLMEQNQMIPEQLKYCPICHSDDIKFILKKEHRLRAAIAAIISIVSMTPPGNEHWEYVCNKCGAHFDSPVAKVTNKQ